MTATAIIVATRNAHKAAEIRSVLGQSIHVVSLAEFADAPAVEEDASTMEGNAVKKALACGQWLSQTARVSVKGASRTFVLADDSGLEVDALGGAPGVHSARFASSGPVNAPDAANNAKLLALMAGVETSRRSARFRCVLALALLPVRPEQGVQGRLLFEGICPGRLAESPSGANGFGYDPLFVPEGFEESFAALGEDVKNRISHRARALAKLKAHLAGR